MVYKFKIYIDEGDWATKEAEYHAWMQANVENYNADSWAKIDWCKHETEDKWHLLIPVGHSDTGVELTDPSWTFSNTLSVLFDGVDEYVDCGDIDDLKGINKMTVSMWVKPITGIVIRDTYIAKWDYSTQGSFSIAAGDSSINELRIYIADANNDGGDNHYSTTNANLTINEWQHLVIVYDGALAAANRIKVYKNAVLVSGTIAGTIPTTLTNATATLKFGKWGGVITRYYVGNLDEISIFTAAFNQADVDEINNEGSPTNVASHSKAANLMSWWRMGDGDTHPTLTDNKGDNDGTMVNTEEGDIEEDVIS